jgi:ketosteroid isomerase-like protein
MRKLVLISSLFASVLMVRPAFAANPNEKAVLAAVDGWKTAMLKKDGAALEKIFHPDLSYGHSSASIQTKAEAIKGVVDGMGWQKIEMTDTTVRFQGNVAIVNGKVDMYEIHKDKNTTSKLVMLSVWTKGPHGWQMIARQAVRRADDDQVIAAKAALAKVAPPPAPAAPAAPAK